MTDIRRSEREPEPIGWVSPCCKTTRMTTRGGDGSAGSPCWTVCLECGETCEPEPVYEDPNMEHAHLIWPQ